MIQLTCTKAQAEVRGREVLTAGMSRAVEVGLAFSADWLGLTKTAVFTDGYTTVDVLEADWSAENVVRVPPEVCTKAGRVVRVGVYGTDGGDVVLPTVWAVLGTVLSGADPSGDESTDPTLPVWATLQKQIESIEVSPEDVQAAVEEYLAENPVEAPQSDWSENDETVPGYVKNRTHWEETTETTIVEDQAHCEREDMVDAAWLLVGTPNVPLMAGGHYVIYQDDEYRGEGITEYDGGNLFVKLAGGNGRVAWLYNDARIITTDPGFFEGYDDFILKLTRLDPVVHTLPEKYLPEGATRTLIVNIFQDDDGNRSVDKTFAEIEEAARKGYSVVAIDGMAVLPLVGLTHTGDSTYAHFGNAMWLSHEYEAPYASVSTSGDIWTYSDGSVWFGAPDSIPLAMPLVVHVTESSDGAVTCDTSYETIASALEAGNSVSLQLNSSKRESRLYNFSCAGDGYICFAGAIEVADDDGDGTPESIYSPGGVFIYSNDTYYIDAEDELPLPTPFTGATADAAGTAGLVPAPSAGDESKLLRGDGTWAEAYSRAEIDAIMGSYIEDINTLVGGDD